MPQLDWFGIPIRSGEAVQKLSKGQLGYGEKRQKPKKVSHQRELEIIKKIQELRNKGHSYGQIAAILDTMQIPTKTRCSGWKAATALGLLKRQEQQVLSSK